MNIACRATTRLLLATTLISTGVISNGIISTAAAEPLHHGATRYDPADLYSGRGVEGTFARLFDLDALALAPHPSPTHDLRQLGARDGPMMEAENAEDQVSRIEAGITFLGQFVDHDITLDVTSTLEERALPGLTKNFRSPDLDLDCVYGDGREASPWLYDGPFLVVGAEIPVTSTKPRHDLARVASTGTALIGDPRNDENLIVAQIQSAFIAFHNAIAQELVDEALEELKLTSISELPASAIGEIFEEARDDTIHYYHRMLVEYFLPKVIGVDRTVDIAAHGRRFYLNPLTRPEADGGGVTLQTPPMPVEFSAAAYRFGHSQVRSTYRLTSAAEPAPIFSLQRRGFSPINEETALDFGLFFPIRGRQTEFQTTSKIDPRLPAILFKLEEFGVVGDDDLGSLAARNLNRGRTFRLPAGEDLFRLIALPPIEAGAVVDSGRSVVILSDLGREKEIGTIAAAHVLKAGYQLNRFDESNASGKISFEPRPVKADDPAIRDCFLSADGDVRETLALNATPLWYYVLHEASCWPVRFGLTEETNQVWPIAQYMPERVSYLADGLSLNRATYGLKENDTEKGQVLGPVGGTIVGEVIIGLIDHYREKTGKGLDHIAKVTVEPTRLEGFGKRITFGDIIRHIGWDSEL